jgi:hypothetical protein
MNVSDNTLKIRSALKNKINLAFTIAKVSFTSGPRVFAIFLDGMMRDKFFHNLVRYRNPAFTKLLEASNGFRTSTKAGVSDFLHAWVGAIETEEAHGGHPVEVGFTEIFQEYLDFFIAYAKAAAMASTLPVISVRWLGDQQEPTFRSMHETIVLLRELEANTYLTRVMDRAEIPSKHTKTLETVKDFIQDLRKTSKEVIASIIVVPPRQNHQRRY